MQIIVPPHAPQRSKMLSQTRDDSAFLTDSIYGQPSFRRSEDNGSQPAVVLTDLSHSIFDQTVIRHIISGKYFSRERLIAQERHNVDTLEKADLGIYRDKATMLVATNWHNRLWCNRK